MMNTKKEPRPFDPPPPWPSEARATGVMGMGVQKLKKMCANGREFGRLELLLLLNVSHVDEPVTCQVNCRIG